MPRPTDRMACARLAWKPGQVPEGGSLVVCSLAGPIPYEKKEPAGIKFHEAVLRQQGLFEDPEAEKPATGKAAAAAGSASAADADGDMQPPPDVNWKGKKKKAKAKRTADNDFYALLGLANERFLATEAQIKNGYRRACLEAHPDKALVGVTDPVEKERIEERFRRIQDAYETLSNAAKRREYDSTDEFDDSLPTDCDPADFFKVFTPAFRRNARWSVNPAVPDVGDAAAAWPAVEAFYDFWFAFKSWREFPHPDEEDPEQAESREHRRWIERGNAKLREKAKKEEGRRLREFVEAAYRLDPRVVARKEAQRAEREAKKAEKEAVRRRAAEEEAGKAAEAAAAKQAAAEAERAAAEEAKRQREADKKAIRKQRQRLRALCEPLLASAQKAAAAPSPSGNGAANGDATSGGALVVDADSVQKLCDRLEHEALSRLCDGMEAAPASCSGAEAAAAAQLQLLRGQLEALDERDAAEVAAKEGVKREAEAALKRAAQQERDARKAALREWGDEELRLLDKAVAKFPAGTQKRWEQVTAYVRTRTLDEVLMMVKERKGASATRLKAQEDWKSAQKKPADYSWELDQRAQAFTDVQVDLKGEAARAYLAQDAGAAVDGGAAAAAAAAAGISPASSQASTATAADVAPSSSGKGVERPMAAAGANGKEGSQAQGGKLVVSADSGSWSEEQELALVKAMKAHGKELEDRWERIAKEVPGKSKAQCFKRFKELKEVFKVKQASGGG